MKETHHKSLNTPDNSTTVQPQECPHQTKLSKIYSYVCTKYYHYSRCNNDVEKNYACKLTSKPKVLAYEKLTV